MATQAAPRITITVTTLPPAGPPSDFFADHGPDRWEVIYFASGGSLILAADTTTPAKLWGYDVDVGRWRVLEEEWKVTARTIADGDEASDLITATTAWIGALHAQYAKGITDNGTAEYFGRTIRDIDG
jgi:hypothetical protein